MKQLTVEQIKTIINENDTLSSSEKKELLRSLKLFTGYNVDLNKNEDLIEIIKDSYELLKSKDGMNREDKLLSTYGLSRDASKEEIIKKRDEILDELYRQSKRTRYIDKSRRITKRLNLVKEHFDILLSRYDNRTLAGDLNDRNVRVAKAKALKQFAELTNQLCEFAVDTTKEDEINDTSKNAFNYIYEDMSEKDINEAQKDINTHPISYTGYGNNTKEYLEPIEYYPNTNIRKPRLRGPFETTEHYEAFLAEYFSRYDFSNPQKTTPEETEKFYTDKLNYAESTIQAYFARVRDSLASLRWLYNYSLNETAGIDSDIEDYEEKIKKYPERKAQYSNWISEGKAKAEVLQEFIKDYEEKLDSVNTIMGKIYNEPTLVGDTSLTVEIKTDGDKLNAIVSPLVTLVDDNNRKKYANYMVDEDGKEVPFDEYEFDINKVTNKDLDDMVTDFVQEIIDQQLVDIDMETIKNANIELYVDDKSYVMPYKDLGLNLIKILKLGTDAYVPRSTYRDDEQVAKYVDQPSRGVQEPEEVATVEQVTTPEEPEEVVEEVAEEANTPTEEVQTEEQPAEEPTNEVSEENPEIILPPPLPIGIEAHEVDEQEEFVEENEEEQDNTNEAEVDESLVEENTEEELEDEEAIDPGHDYHVENEDEDDYDDEANYSNITEPEFGESGLDESPLTQEELHSLYKVKSVRKPRHFKKTIAAGVLGGVLTAFGLATVNGPAIAGGAALLTGTAGFNWKNVYRAVQKFKLKTIARRHNAKAFFGKNGRIRMLNKDGSDMSDKKARAIQNEIDNKINAWIDPERAPLVTLDNLGDSFILENDEEAYYTATDKDIKEYRDMVDQRIAREASKFESIGPSIPGFDDEEELEESEEYEEEQEQEVEPKKSLFSRIKDKFTEEVEEPLEDEYFDDEEDLEGEDEHQEEQEAEQIDDNRPKPLYEKPNEINSDADLYHELVRLNPYLATEFKQDTTGWWLEMEEPEKIILPEGFEYIDGVGITNIDSGVDYPIHIDVFKPVQYEAPTIINEAEHAEVLEENIDAIIEKYGNLLDGISDEDILRIAQLDSTFNYDEIKAAAEKMNSRSL